ncbi:MAG: iron ABC transporter permease [Pseudomonadales bacterium]|jgi:iron complex transport system permease protein|nr:iron ABC transporter permease [Pseudomonadales bacterium]
MRRFYALLLCAAIAGLFFWELNSGPSGVSLFSAFMELWRGEEGIAGVILWELRLPRALLALTCGACLGMSGAALQGLLRNPLASPDILGVSQVAALAAVLALYYGLSTRAWFVLPLCATAGAALAAALMFGLNRRRGESATIILSGIAISAVAGSLISLALNFAPNPYALQEIYYWLLGSVANRSLYELAFALPFMALGVALLWRQRRFLDALTLGEDTANTLGFNAKHASARIILGCACSVGAVVAVSGNIGFVGLVAPHLMRPLARSRPSLILSLSAAGGGALVLLADALVQNAPGAQELQLGVLTSMLGGPFFLYLLFTKREWFR